MLKGKTAVVTGASRGIGRAIALAMGENGARLAVIYAGNEAAAKDVCQQLQKQGGVARPYRCDVADYGQAKEVCELILAELGPVDILVNNAGIVKDGLLLKMTEEDFCAVVKVNLNGAFNFTKHLTRSLIKSPAGRIINISSVTALSGNPGQANYAAAKAGLIGLTKSTAKELAARKVTCNAIAPGFIVTDMTDRLSQSQKDKLTAAIPLSELGRPEDVASLALFLASDQAAYITGEVIRVDGGLSM